MKKIITALFLLTLTFGRSDNTKNGIGLSIADQGAGIFYHRNIKSYEFIKLGVDIRWLDIRPSEEIPTYNYYTGQYENTNKISLAIFPLFGTLYYYPFEGKIANNFSPFISAKLGPVLVLDADEGDESFSHRWLKARREFTYGSNIGIGIEFRQPGKVHYSIELSYDIVALKTDIDNYSNLNGSVLSFSIQR